MDSNDETEKLFKNLKKEIAKARNAEYQKRWRQKNREQYNYERKRRARRTSHFPRTNTTWHESEKLLLFEFEGTDLELAERLQRSMQSIQCMRNRIAHSQRMVEMYGNPVGPKGRQQKTVMSDMPKYRHLKKEKAPSLYVQRQQDFERIRSANEVQDTADGASGEGT